MYRILQIEDLPSDAYLVSREVKKVLNASVFQVVDTKEAFIKAILEFKPDVIISDFSIPGFGWHSALNLAHKYAPKTPFIIVTGSLSTAINKECMKAGVSEFICKDNIHELGPAILNVLK